jgi:hypothetical protein
MYRQKQDYQMAVNLAKKLAKLFKNVVDKTFSRQTKTRLSNCCKFGKKLATLLKNVVDKTFSR